MFNELFNLPSTSKESIIGWILFVGFLCLIIICVTLCSLAKSLVSLFHWNKDNWLNQLHKCDSNNTLLYTDCLKQCKTREECESFVKKHNQEQENS